MDYNQEKLQNHPRLSRLAWLPVLLLLAAMAAFWVADLRTAHELPFLLLALNFVFSLLASFLIAFLIARSFLVRRTPELLLVGCGVIAWGTAGLAGVTFGILGAAGAPLDTNLFITTHNLCVWLSALCHLAGAAFSLRPKREIPAAGRWLAAAFTLILGAVGLVALSALAHWTPIFFVQGQGGTLVRDFVLASATAMFLLSAALLGGLNRKSLSPFLYWYTLALALIAVGLFGIMIESVHASALSWTGRAAQFISGVYMLIAAVAAARETGTWRISLAPVEPAGSENAFLASLRQHTPVWWVLRYGLAVGAVAAAMGLRAAVTAWGGPGLPPYITLYPVVMVVALLGGFGPGLVATALAGIAAGYWILPPAGQFIIASPMDRLGLVLFIGMGLFMSAVAELYRGYRHKAAAYDHEVAVRESEQRFRRFYESSLLGVIFWNMDGVITDANDKFLNMVGYSRGDLAAGRMDWVRMTPPEYRHQDDSSTKELKATGVNQQPFEKEYIRKDGTRIPILVPGAMLDEARSNGVAFVLDITDRKRAEAAAQEGRERLDLALISARMATFDLDIVKNKRIWSHGVHSLLGTNPETFTGAAEEFFQAIHPEDRSAVQAALVRAVERTGEYETEYRAVWPDGSVHHISARGKVHYDNAGRAVQMTGVCWDVTAHKAAETEIRRRVEELRAANEELTRFNRVTVGRELRIIELKKQVNELGARLGQPPRYPTELDDQARPAQ
jgi:PAS domain S-box-containing protein